MSRKKITKTNSQGQPRKVFCLLLIIVFTCIFSYGYLIRDTILNIVARQNFETELSALSSKIISLETQYIKAKNAVTLESAQDMGFVAVSAPKYVTLKVAGPNLSLAGQRD